MRPPFSFLTSRLYSSKGSLGCVQRLNIYVKPTRQISFWQKQTRLKNEKYLENEHCTAKEVKTTYLLSILKLVFLLRLRSKYKSHVICKGMFQCKMLKHISRISQSIEKTIIHSVRGQIIFFNLALTEINMHVKFDLKVCICLYNRFINLTFMVTVICKI